MTSPNQITITDEMVETVRLAIAGVRGHSYPHDDLYARAALTAALPLITAEVRKQVVEECAQVAKIWTRVGELLLRTGELTAQEKRTALAVANGILAAIRALTAPDAEEPQP